MNVFTQVLARQNKDYVKKSGNSALYLLIGINDSWDKIPLNLEWKAGKFDDNTGQVLKRTKDDIDVNDYNLMIRTEINKINEIFKKYRLAEKILTIELLKREYLEPDKSKDFLEYLSYKIKSRLKNKDISEGTRKVHFSLYWQLERFKKKISFQDVSPKFIEKFQNYLRKDLAQNTVASYLRNLKAYITLAIDELNLKIENPYKKAKVDLSEGDSDRIHLMKVELKIMRDYYDSLEKSSLERVAFSRFFVACYTGLRISDISRITQEMLDNAIISEQLGIFPKKTSRYKKILYVKLNRISIQYIQEMLQNLTDYIETLPQWRKTAKLTEQYCNRILTDKCYELGINKKITFHVGRHTFATNYLRAGGDVVKLMHALGHSNINITMKYVHIVDQEKTDAMQSLADFYDA